MSSILASGPTTIGSDGLVATEVFPANKVQAAPRRLLYIPALDGIRALAVLSVVGLHLGLFPGGNNGVTVFFVLSGFLITGLLLEEYDTSRRICYQQFFLRRGLRLFPALVALLAVHLIYTLVYKSGYERKAGLSAAVASLCYGGNFCLTWKLFPMRHLSHTWSLAIEEQFYLIWPFLLVALVHYTRNRKTLLIVVLALAASLALERLLLAQLGATETRLYMMLDTRADGLLLGAAAAFLFRRRALDGSKQGRRVLGAMTFLGFVALMAHLFLGIGAVARSTSFRSLSSYTLAAIVAAVVIFGVAAEFHATRPIARILETRPLVYVGRISYGIYLWHLVIIGILDDQFPTISGPAAVVLRLLITFVVAIFSFHVVERPFLRLKYRFARPTANR